MAQVLRPTAVMAQWLRVYGCSSNAPTTNIKAFHSSSTHTPPRQVPLYEQQGVGWHGGMKQGQVPQEEVPQRRPSAGTCSHSPEYRLHLYSVQ